MVRPVRGNGGVAGSPSASTAVTQRVALNVRAVRVRTQLLSESVDRWAYSRASVARGLRVPAGELPDTGTPNPTNGEQQMTGRSEAAAVLDAMATSRLQTTTDHQVYPQMKEMQR
jgi:hypothetical protein